MRILTIGNSKNIEILTNFLSENKDFLVFSTSENSRANFVDIHPENVVELKEFALANEINLTIATGNGLPDVDYLKEFGENNLAILMPDKEALKIVSSKTFGKKFIYKNKMKTPRFAFFEKSNLAIEYIKTAEFPLVIKPDEHSETETAYIAETFSAAKKQVEKLFQRGNSKVLIEEYIYGKEASIYILSDGFNPIIAGITANFQNEISIQNPNFIDKTLEEKIYNEIIFPTISALARENAEYIGVLGFDIIITPKKEGQNACGSEVYLIEYNSFFKDIDCEIILKGTNENWAKLFMDTIIGTLQDNFKTPFSIQRNEECSGAFRLDNDIISDSARTLGSLKCKLLAEGLPEELLLEAEKMWRL